MRIINDTILNETNLVADKVSEVLDLGFIQDIAVHTIFTSTTCAGTLSLECSNNDVDWTDVSGSAQTINNNSASTMITITNANYAFIRVKFDHTSGTLSTLKVIINGKGM